MKHPSIRTNAELNQEFALRIAGLFPTWNDGLWLRTASKKLVALPDYCNDVGAVFPFVQAWSQRHPHSEIKLEFLRDRDPNGNSVGETGCWIAWLDTLGQMRVPGHRDRDDLVHAYSHESLATALVVVLLRASGLIVSPEGD